MTSTAQSLADALRATPGVDAWQVATTRREEAQVYLIGTEIEEARRMVASEESSVSLHNRHAPHAADGRMAPMGRGQRARRSARPR